MPTEFHESKIRALCADNGFVTKGFMSFVTEAMAKGLAENHVYDDEFGYPMYEKAIASPVMISTWEAIRGSKSVDNLISTMRMRLHKELRGCVFYNEVLANLGIDLVDFSKFSNIISQQVSIVPDAWKFDGKDVLACEVSDTSRVNWRKLSCMSLIDDVLSHCLDMRISLCEVDARSGNKFFHSLNRVFELEYDGSGITSVDGWSNMTDAKKLRLYYSEKELFSDEYYDGSFQMG